MIALIDNGHGRETAGKRSPDGRFLEYEWTREIADSVVRGLQNMGHTALWLTPEETDVPLKERVRRVNQYCDQFGKENVCVISIHCNAAKNDGKWHDARGWSCYTSRGQTAGDRLADSLYLAASIHLVGHQLRRDWSDGDPDFEADFYLLKHTKCACVISECGFMDNKESLRYLESDEGKIAFTNLHIDGFRLFLTSFTVQSNLENKSY